MTSSLKGYRFPVSVISQAIWLYHRFSLSYRDIEEMLKYRGIDVSYETIRNWCYKFGSYYDKVLRKRKYKRGDKWHLDEMEVKIKGEKYILFRALDSEGHELDVLLQRRKNKKSAIRFLSKLLDTQPSPRVVVSLGATISQLKNSFLKLNISVIKA